MNGSPGQALEESGKLEAQTLWPNSASQGQLNLTALSSPVKGLGCLESALISFKDKPQSAWQFITVYYSDLRSYPRCVMKSHREAAGSPPFPLHTSGCLGYAFNLKRIFNLQKQRMCSFNKYLLPPGNGLRHGKGILLPLSKALLSMAVQLLLCLGAEQWGSCFEAPPAPPACPPPMASCFCQPGFPLEGCLYKGVLWGS